MYNIITELVKIEDVTKEITESIDNKRSELPRRIHEACRIIDERIRTEQIDKIADIKEQSNQAADARVSQIRKEAQQLFSKIEEDYYANQEQWIDEIFSQTIKSKEI